MNEPITNTGVRDYTGIKTKDNNISNWFLSLKFNKNEPIYNYHSGLVAGILTRDLAMIKPFIEEKKEGIITEELLSSVFEDARVLVEDYNWKSWDLMNIINQFFGS